jgi:hypothetical protein
VAADKLNTMPKIGTLLSSLAVKAGIPADHKALIDILSKAELSNTEISDEIGNAIEGAVMSLEAAKNNPVLKAHYFAQALNGIDAETLRAMDEFGLDEDSKSELLAEKSSMKRVSGLISKIKTLEAKKSDAARKDQPDIQAKINELQKEKADAIHAMEAKLTAMQSTHANELTAMSVRNILAAKKYAASHLPDDVNLTTADVVTQRALAAQGAQIVRENGVLKLVNASDPSMDFYDKSNNRPSVEQFIDAALAENKLLAVSNAPNAPVSTNGNNYNGQQFNPPAQPGGSVPLDAHQHDDLFDAALADFTKGSGMPQSVPA